jgi:sec-independent protein translocase protein TatA
MFGLGGTEVIIVLALGLVLFGAKKLPELGKGLGQGIREFKKSTSDLRSDLEGSLNDSPSSVSANTPVVTASVSNGNQA